MNAKLMYYLKIIATVDFWEKIFYSFRILGPVAPILLAATESIIPALPLIAIVTLNVAAHGIILGFLYSWIGACAGSALVFFFFRKVVKRLFIRLVERYEKIRRAKNLIDNTNVKALFLIAILPFTPSSLLNYSFGISDYDERKYLVTMICSKFVLILFLTIFGQSFVQAFKDPRFIILAAVLVLVFYVISKIVRKKHKI